MSFIFLNLFLVLLVFISNAYSFTELEELKKQAIYINSLNTTWIASYDNVPSNITLGTILDNEQISLKYIDDEINSIPDKFDVRLNWPECQQITRHVRDQGSCGSCWAFATASTISDRICIASKGKSKVMISAEDLLACCDSCGSGCNGGYPANAFKYWVENGLVSGGDYGDKNTCRPYEIPGCSHHVKGSKPPCSGKVNTPKCKRTCVNHYDYKKDLHFGSQFYGISRSVKAIQSEIMRNGPVKASFSVYSDFPLYKSGVYQKTLFSRPSGGHAVKVMGWGVENNVPYWLVANSWNEEWGDKGFFKIIRGVNHCGFESNIIGGIPKLRVNQIRKI